jgi:hypothetical protein
MDRLQSLPEVDRSIDSSCVTARFPYCKFLHRGVSPALSGEETVERQRICTMAGWRPTRLPKYSSPEPTASSCRSVSRRCNIARFRSRARRATSTCRDSVLATRRSTLRSIWIGRGGYLGKRADIEKRQPRNPHPGHHGRSRTGTSFSIGIIPRSGRPDNERKVEN